MSFWTQFAQASCYPDKCQCELPLDAIIRQPSSFWSSFAYVLAGIAIYRFVRPKSQELKLWAGACILMGFSSLFGHGSFIRFALAMDFAAIILILSFFALLNFLLLLKQSFAKILLIFSTYFFVLIWAMYYMNKETKIFMCLALFTFALFDVGRDKGWSFFKSKDMQLSLVSLVVAFSLFLLDEKHIFCEPESLFQLHSLWHIGTAISLYFYGKWRFAEIRER